MTRGGGVMEWNYKELAATLRAQMSSSHPPLVVLNNDSNRIRRIQPEPDRECVNDIDGNKD